MGGANPISAWSAGCGGGGYTIVLTGAAFPPCDGDVNDDGLVDIDDIQAVVIDFGCMVGGPPCTGDVNGDGTTDIDDIQEVVINFGECNAL